MLNNVIQTPYTQGNDKILNIRKGQSLEKYFVDCQFTYAPLIGMFCKKCIYFKTHKIHHKTLRVIY